MKYQGMPALMWLLYKKIVQQCSVQYSKGRRITGKEGDLVCKAEVQSNYRASSRV